MLRFLSCYSRYDQNPLFDLSVEVTVCVPTRTLQDPVVRKSNRLANQLLFWFPWRQFQRYSQDSASTGSMLCISEIPAFGWGLTLNFRSRKRKKTFISFSKSPENFWPRNFLSPVHERACGAQKRACGAEKWACGAQEWVCCTPEAAARPGTW